MDGGAWWAAVHWVAQSRTRLSDFAFTFHFLALEKAMATHSSVLAWRTLGMGEPGGLPSMGLHRVRHDWSDLAAAVYFCHLFLIASASVRSIPFPSFIVPIFAWNVPLVSVTFLEELSSLSHSIVFLYFFALITEEGFLISPCYSLELCIQIGISFFFSFAFSFSSFLSYL